MGPRLLLPVCVLLGACSSDPPPPKTTTADANTPAADEVLFASDEVVLQPGDEKYMCWAGRLPTDRNVVVSRIHGEYGPGTHHVFFAWTLVPEPEGQTECPVLFKTSWIPIYLGGVNTSPLAMPDGAGIDLGQGKQLLLQLHLQNTTPEPITNQVTMHMKVIEQDAGFVPAGIFGMDNRDIAIPPNSGDVDTSTMTCVPNKELNVFSVLGHMHKLGRSLHVTRGGAPVFDQTWNFDDQPIVPFEAKFAATDVLGLHCTHRNIHPFPVTYGESSDTEMCAVVFYYTPYDQLAGCIYAPPPPADGGAVP